MTAVHNTAQDSSDNLIIHTIITAHMLSAGRGQKFLALSSYTYGSVNLKTIEPVVVKSTKQICSQAQYITSIQ